MFFSDSILWECKFRNVSHLLVPGTPPVTAVDFNFSTWVLFISCVCVGMLSLTILLKAQPPTVGPGFIQKNHFPTSNIRKCVWNGYPVLVTISPGVQALPLWHLEQ